MTRREFLKFAGLTAVAATFISPTAYKRMSSLPTWQRTLEIMDGRMPLATADECIAIIGWAQRQPANPLGLWVTHQLLRNNLLHNQCADTRAKVVRSREFESLINSHGYLLDGSYNVRS